MKRFTVILLMVASSLACSAAKFGEGIKAPAPITPNYPKPMSPQVGDYLNTNQNKSKKAKQVISPTSQNAPTIFDSQGKSLGKLSSDKYDPESVANPYGAGSKYKADGVNNPYGKHGGQFGSESVANPYATNAPEVVDSQGVSLGKLSANKYDPDSIGNPYGAGSPYKADAINNPYSKNHVDRAVIESITKPKGANTTGTHAAETKSPSFLKRLFGKSKAEKK